MSKKGKQYTIYIRSTKESIPVNKEEFDAYYHDINIYRIRQQRHGRCVCPASKRLTCDMDCLTCPFHRMGDTRSLDYTETDDEGNETAWVDEIPDDSPLLEDIIIEASEMKALYGEIADRLIADEVPTRMPGASWAKTTVQHIIRNEKYCGDCLFQKAFIANPITHQQVRNNGELPKYLVEDCLPAIVDKETWKLAQAVAARHTPHRQAPNERYPFTGKLFCGICGKPYYYYHYTTTNKQPLAAYRCMSRKTQSAVEVPGQTYTPPHKATFNLNASPELIAYRERYCKPPKERPMLCTDIRISIDLPQKAFCRAWNLIVAKKLRYQATLRSTVDNAEDILVRYRAEEMCLLIDEIGKINEFSYPLMLKTLDRVVVNANGKLTFIFQSGIKITV